MGRGCKRLPTDEIDMLFCQVYDGGTGCLELPTEDDDAAAQEFEHIYNAQWRDFKASTKVNYTSYLRRWIEYVKEQQLSDPSFTAVVHPVAKAARFLRHLLETRFVGAKDPAGAVDNIRKALGHLRNVQRGIPDPSTFSKHPLIAAVSSEAHKRRSAARAEVDLMEAVGARLLTRTELVLLVDTARAAGTPQAYKAAFGFAGSVAAGFRADDPCGLRWSNLLVQETPTPVEPVPMEACYKLYALQPRISLPLLCLRLR
ncbi:MAG: hypothetical protein J3K34DRAFT_420630 [Monoraphidium minutum]|nr:MAG: hypothetical protein J3K34DRAFT_420630 [Monoraphidium minutum]